VIISQDRKKISLTHTDLAVNEQALKAVANADAAITALGIEMCLPDDAVDRTDPTVEVGRSAAQESDFTPLVVSRGPQTVASIRQAYTSAASNGESGEPRESDRLVGTLVHRLLQRFGVPLDPVEIDERTVLRLLQASDFPSGAIDDAAEDLAVRALGTYRVICGRSDVRDLYRAGECLHEVPFTMRVDDDIVRGTIDCLVRTAPNRMALLEFKTGRPREQDRLQLDLYRQAAERLFPGVTVEARLVYASHLA
jgi:ATP-dependent exoDNAse (exonuclease V) beta subunit